jgi:hypothetical protein
MLFLVAFFFFFGRYHSLILSYIIPIVVQLGGIFAWEASGDYNHDLLGAMIGTANQDETESP